ncbi:hypothetical protein V5O48_001499 [Marasmius crinis-equi]|uniref:Uncharacterized protein n=1 Tax=Marasmius crinis-equi TaxID=585013 RepID=A0ABR3FZF5_9AGAR
MPSGEPNSTISYACNCLNVKLRCKRVDENPDLPSSQDYTPVYIERDEDIKITFPHLTLRTRKRAPFVPDPTKTARYTSLTCLCCETLVYRIHQVVSVDDHHNLKEGPIITKGWTETEVLRSSSGWVEVHQHVLTDDGIGRQENSPQFSRTFGIVIAPSLSSAPTETISGRALELEDVPKYKLPPIPPIFPEPKSTTSLFATLASVAGRKSSNLRSSAEEYIDEIVKKKIHEIRLAENQLKKDVQFLLTRHNDGIKKAEQENNPFTPHPTPSPQPQNVPDASKTERLTSVVHDFVPTTPAQPRSPPPKVPGPRVSALSASLATSSFHHPRAQQHSPPRSPVSIQSASSATLTMQPTAAEVGNVHRWGRNTNERLDIATSFNYFLNLEEEMERRKRELQGTSTSTAQSSQAAGSSSTAKKQTEDPKKKQDVRKLEVESSESEVATSKLAPSPKSKGKRKVTFDVKVDQPESAQSIDPVDPEDMIFDFEDEGGQRGARSEGSLPLVEQSASRPPNPQRRGSKELPEMLSNLRPSSLPNPSYLPNHTADQSTSTPPPSITKEARASSYRSSPSHQVDPTDARSLPIPGRAQSGNTAQETSRSVRDEEILTKLAASMPSHRAAWRNNREEFTSFFSEKSDDWMEDIEETAAPDTNDRDREDAWQNTGVPGSVPIAIHRPNTKPQRTPLSLASYQGERFLSMNNVLNRGRTSTVEPVPEVEEQTNNEGLITDSTPIRDDTRIASGRASNHKK